MLNNLTRESFEPQLKTAFRITRLEHEPVELVLVEATDKTPAGAPGEQFSLIFAGPADQPLAQQIYPLEHPVMGRLDLFLVPVGEGKTGRLYEAFFNRTAFGNE